MEQNHFKFGKRTIAPRIALSIGWSCGPIQGIARW